VALARADFTSVLEEWETAKASGLAQGQSSSEDSDDIGDDSQPDLMALVVRAIQSEQELSDVAAAAATSVRDAGGEKEEQIAVRLSPPLRHWPAVIQSLTRHASHTPASSDQRILSIRLPRSAVPALVRCAAWLPLRLQMLPRQGQRTRTKPHLLGLTQPNTNSKLQRARGLSAQSASVSASALQLRMLLQCLQSGVQPKMNLRVGLEQ
jgi:hypothetical protein